MYPSQQKPDLFAQACVEKNEKRIITHVSKKKIHKFLSSYYLEKEDSLIKTIHHLIRLLMES